MHHQPADSRIGRRKPKTLIDGFGAFYLHRLALFKNATHILDIEKTIETYLASLDLRDGSTPLQHFEFVDSRATLWVELSDALVGLLGKLFSYADNTPLLEIGDRGGGRQSKRPSASRAQRAQGPPQPIDRRLCGVRPLYRVARRSSAPHCDPRLLTIRPTAVRGWFRGGG